MKITAALLASVSLAAFPAYGQTAVGGSRVTDLPPASIPLSGSEAVNVVQGGVSKQTTVGQIESNTFAPSCSNPGFLYFPGTGPLSCLPPISGVVTAPAGSTVTSFSLGSVAGGLNMIDPRSSPYNAKCDGVSDDTVPLQAWAAALGSGATGYVPGVCVFKGPLTIAAGGATNLSLVGNGATSELLYKGSATTGEIVTVGQANVAATGCSVYNMTIRGVSVQSTTVMTGGDGVLLNEICQANYSNFSVGSNLGATPTWFNAVHYNGGNTIRTMQHMFVGSNKGVILNGDAAASPGPYQMTDPFFEQGIEVGAVAGVNIAGAVGGFVMDQNDDLLNHTNVLIDQSQVARANVQLFFLGGFFSDFNNFAGGVGIDVQDPGGVNSTLVFNNAWLASANNECLKLEAGTAWQVYVHGGEVINCHGNGAIWNNSINNVITIAGTTFDQNSNYGFNNVVDDAQVSLMGVRYGFNGLNGVTGYPVSQSYISPANDIVTQAKTSGAVLAGTTQIVGTVGRCSLWVQGNSGDGSGTVVPGSSDFATPGCTFSLGNGTYPFSVVNSSSFVSGASAGVSCSGSPTVLFTSVNGIVTHC